MSDHITLADLVDRHQGRVIEVDGLRGVLHNWWGVRDLVHVEVRWLKGNRTTWHHDYFPADTPCVVLTPSEVGG